LADICVEQLGKIQSFAVLLLLFCLSVVQYNQPCTRL